MTTRGRCLLAAGFAAALCSVLLNERELLRVAAYVIALPLLSAALAARARVGLTATRQLVPDRIPVGEHTDVVLRVRTTGRVRVGGLLLEDGAPYTLGGPLRFAVAQASRHAGVRLHYRLRPTMRGIYQVGPLRARLTDPFGLAEFDRELSANSRIIALPRTVGLLGLPSGVGVGASHSASARLRSGQGDDDPLVRQYRHGDDLRRVHWRSTARRDELMVRVEERPSHGGTTVLLDHRASAHRGHGPASSMEWAVSFCASVCVHLRRCGHSVRLVAEGGAPLAGEIGELGGDDGLLDALAMLHPAHRRDVGCSTDPAPGNELIAIFGALSPAAAAEVAGCRARRTGNLAVLLDVSQWASSADARAVAPAESAQLLTNAGWGVVVAAPTTPMAEVWARLCHSGSSWPAVAGQV